MARACAAAFLAVATLTASASAELLLKSNSTAQFSIKDQIYLNGALFAESAAINDVVGCQEYPAGTSSIKVCGCGAKVIAHLMTECQTYQRYDTQIGKCDCGKDECHDHKLESGYPNTFNWKAHSFEIASCS